MRILTVLALAAIFFLPSQLCLQAQQSSQAARDAAYPPYLDLINDQPVYLPFTTPAPPLYDARVVRPKQRGDRTLAEETLSYWDDADGLLGPYNTNDFPLHAAWFKLDAPAYLKRIRVGLIGASGTVRVRVFGQDGGTSLPDLQQDLMTPQIADKPTNSDSEVYFAPVNVNEEVLLDENFFYVVIDEFSPGIGTVSDRMNHEIYCSAPNQAISVYQVFQHSSGQLAINRDQNNTISNNAFLVEVDLDFPTKSGPRHFRDVTTEIGLPGDLFYETVAWADIDADGWLDLMASGRLFKNTDGEFSDITAEAGIEELPDRAGANHFLDLNNDGRIDIIHISDELWLMYINEGGASFREVEWPNPPQLTDRLGDLAGLAIADVNYDGFPDFFLAQSWEDWPPDNNVIPSPNYFFVNNGDLTFSDRSSLIYGPGRNRTHSRGGARWADYDDDGDQDLLVINYVLQRDELYRNNGDLSFTNVIADARLDINSLGTSAHGTGGEFADYDNDGDLDLLLSQVGHARFFEEFDHRWTTIYRNEGQGRFADQFGQHGLRYEDALASGAFADLNNDGLLDIFLPSFYGCRYSAVYEQQPDHSFAYKTFDYGFQNHRCGNFNRVYSATFADFNNDGLLDLVTAEERQLRLYRNFNEDAGNFLELDLIPQGGNSMAIGARATVYAGGQQFTQEISAGNGVRSQRPARLHFGLGDATRIDAVKVRWPSNPPLVEFFDGPQLNTIGSLRQGQGTPTSVAADAREQQGLTFWPNPAEHEVHVQLPRLAGASPSLEVRDALGKLVLQRTLENRRHNLSAQTLSLNDLPQGVYFLRLLHDGAVYGGSFIKGKDSNAQ